MNPTKRKKLEIVFFRRLLIPGSNLAHGNNFFCVVFNSYRTHGGKG